MLVLTRKMNEQILIGNDIKITLVRVRGNSVRIGIEAPREVRVVRGELTVHDETSGAKNGERSCEELQLSEREEAFAHPVVARPLSESKVKKAAIQSSGAVSRLDEFPVVSHPSFDTSVARQVFVGRVDREGESVELRRAPLARFMSAQ